MREIGAKNWAPVAGDRAALELDGRGKRKIHSHSGLPRLAPHTRISLTLRAWQLSSQASVGPRGRGLFDAARAEQGWPPRFTRRSRRTTNHAAAKKSKTSLWGEYGPGISAGRQADHRW